MSENMHEQYIARCLTLAAFAEGKTATNPMVGAIIVHNGAIIGQGYHQYYGGLHAERNAVNSVKDRSLLPQSTLYVNLEPCSHFGKTPPCADFIIEHKIPKVVIGVSDINPKVNGKGIEKLRNAGVEVVAGVLENECRHLNRRFITNIEKHRPFIILKWAETADGFIDCVRENANFPPLKISNSITKTLNHQVRTQEAAIMVGTKTALLDNPKLTAPKWTGNNPVRAIIDRNLIIPQNYNIFDNSSKTIIFNNLKQENIKNIYYEKIDFSQNIIPQMLDRLLANGLSSVIVEGGQQLLQSFIDENLFDEIQVETSQQLINKGIKAPILPKIQPEKTLFYEGNKVAIFNIVNFV